MDEESDHVFKDELILPDGPQQSLRSLVLYPLEAMVVAGIAAPAHLFLAGQVG